MVMVWASELDVDAYVALGRGVVVPRLACPGCGRPLQFWGWYQRDVRVTMELVHRLEVRRGRCGGCGRTHALLPGFVTWGRLDDVGLIGRALEAMNEGGELVGVVARSLDRPYATVRGWRRRFAARAVLLAVGFCRFCVAVGGLAPRLSGDPVTVALGAIEAARVTARRRLGDRVGGVWRLANAVVGSHLLSTNMDPPWSAD